MENILSNVSHGDLLMFLGGIFAVVMSTVFAMAQYFVNSLMRAQTIQFRNMKEQFSELSGDMKDIDCELRRLKTTLPSDYVRRTEMKAMLNK